MLDRFLKMVTGSQNKSSAPSQSQNPPPQAPPPVTSTQAPPAAQAAARAAGIPHPEEPMNPAATLANTSLDAVMSKWFSDWGVPAQWQDFWRHAIDIQVYDVYPASMNMNQDTPAATWDAGGQRHLVIKPKWLNPGVIAHEQAHNSYALLTEAQKAAFAAAYHPLINTDPTIVLLYSKNKYGLSSDVEGHAEVYRYIGQYMPAHLKQFYPRLF